MGPERAEAEETRALPLTCGCFLLYLSFLVQRLRSCMGMSLLAPTLPSFKNGKYYFRGLSSKVYPKYVPGSLEYWTEVGGVQSLHHQWP